MQGPISTLRQERQVSALARHRKLWALNVGSAPSLTEEKLASEIFHPLDLYWAREMVYGYWQPKLPPLFSLVPRWLEYVKSYLYSETGKTVASLLEHCWNIRCMFQNSVSTGRSWDLGNFLLSIWHCSRVGIMVRRYFKLSYWGLYSWLYSSPEYRRLSTSFWISLKGNLSSFCCWTDVKF